MASKKSTESIEESIQESLVEGDTLFPEGYLSGTISVSGKDNEEEEENEEENTSTKEEETEEEVIISDENRNNEEPSPIKILATYLRDEGIVEFNDEDFEDKEEFINQIIENRIDSGIEEYKKELPNIIQDLINNYEEGVPLNELLGLKVQNENYSKLTSEDLSKSEPMQKNVVREYYKRLGWKEDKISNKIEKLETKGELEEESLDLLEELQEMLSTEEENMKQYTKAQEQERIKSYEAAKTNFKESLNKRDEVFPGLKLSQKHKEQLFNGIFVADKDGKNELMKKIEKDPDYNLKVAYMALVLDWDLTALDKLASTKAAKGLRDAIEGSKSKLMGKGIEANKSTGQKFDPSVAQGAMKRN